MDTVPDQQQVLESLDGLWPMRGDVDLDLIDGDFYWRCCRSDVTSEIERLTENIRVQDGPPGQDRGQDERFLADLAHLDAFLASVQAEVPNFFEWIDSGLPPRMRDATFATWRGRGLTVDTSDRQTIWAQIGVTARDWDGARVAAVLAQRVAAQVERMPDWFVRTGSDERRDREAIVLEFAIYRPGLALPHFIPLAGYDSSHRPALATAMITVTTTYPLPPAPVIAAAYDATVREQRGWTSELPGNINNQQPHVAIRTWALALLMKAGSTFSQASRIVGDHIGHEEIPGQNRFGDDRRLLLERVPEAHSHVYVNASRHHTP